jgi:hypothetical protein
LKPEVFTNFGFFIACYFLNESVCGF